jgi:uncharacterized protein (TIGR03437 family)
MPRPVPVVLAVVLGLLATPALPQQFPFFTGPSNQMLPPSINQNGSLAAFGSAVDPDGTPGNATDAWLWNGAGGTLTRLTNYASASPSSMVTALMLSSDGASMAYTSYVSSSGRTEEVHLIDTAAGTDRLLVQDTQGCIQPLIACPITGCFFPCVHQPHITPDKRILYTVSRNQPFYVVTADGAVTQLPIYSGYLAAGPQRVISDSGLVVFTSSAPTGPSLVAQAPDIYLMNLDGTGVRNITHFASPNLYGQNGVISADGQTIAFESNYGPGGNISEVQQIFAINADGSGLRQLSAGPDPVTNPSLTADGSLVAYVQSGQIKVVPTSGSGAVTVLTNFQYSTARDPVVSDDGTEVGFSLGPPNSGRGALFEIPAAGTSRKAIFAPVSLNLNGIFGVAGTEAPSPGSLISAYGLNFADDQLTTPQGYPLSATLGGISLLVNGQPALIAAVTPWQINAQLPQDVPPGNATFQVSSHGNSANTVTAQVRVVAPSVFAYLTQGEQPGTVYWQAAAFHPGTATPADAAHPATAGETLETYGSGLGITNPTVAPGQPSPASPPASAAVKPQVTIGNLPAQVTFGGLVPGLVGVYQINAVVPAGLTPGQQSLVWTVDNRGASIFVH